MSAGLRITKLIVTADHIIVSKLLSVHRGNITIQCVISMTVHAFCVVASFYFYF